MGPCHISHSANLPSPHLCVSCGLSQPPCFTRSSLKAVASGYSSPSQHRYLAQTPGQSFSTLSFWTYHGDQLSRSQSERYVPVLPTSSRGSAESLSPSVPRSNASLKLEIVCNIMVERSDEKLWNHLSMSWFDCLPTPSSPLLHAGFLPIRPLLAPSLFILQILSPSSKKDQSGAYTWHGNFQPEWLDWSYIWKQGLLKCQATGTGDVTSSAFSAAEWVVATLS